MIANTRCGTLELTQEKKATARYDQKIKNQKSTESNHGNRQIASGRANARRLKIKPPQSSGNGPRDKTIDRKIQQNRFRDGRRACARACVRAFQPGLQPSRSNHRSNHRSSHRSRHRSNHCSNHCSNHRSNHRCLYPSQQTTHVAGNHLTPPRRNPSSPCPFGS